MELLAASLTLLTVARFAGEGWGSVAAYIIMVNALIAVAFIDLPPAFIIPDEISLTGLVLGLAMSALFPLLHAPCAFGLEGWVGGLVSSALGACAGGGLIYIVRVSARLILKKEAMGLGDVKLMAMVGAFIGWRLVLLGIFLGSFFGSVVGVALIALGKADMQTKVPFGPYLALGALVSLFYGDALLSWYFGLLRGPM